jgi:hypothetical protein
MGGAKIVGSSFLENLTPAKLGKAFCCGVRIDHHKSTHRIGSVYGGDPPLYERVGLSTVPEWACRGVVW